MDLSTIPDNPQSFLSTTLSPTCITATTPISDYGSLWAPAQNENTFPNSVTDCPEIIVPKTQGGEADSYDSDGQYSWTTAPETTDGGTNAPLDDYSCGRESDDGQDISRAVSDAWKSAGYPTFKTDIDYGQGKPASPDEDSGLTISGSFDVSPLNSEATTSPPIPTSTHPVATATSPESFTDGTFEPSLVPKPLNLSRPAHDPKELHTQHTADRSLPTPSGATGAESNDLESLFEDVQNRYASGQLSSLADCGAPSLDVDASEAVATVPTETKNNGPSRIVEDTGHGVEYSASERNSLGDPSLMRSIAESQRDYQASKVSRTSDASATDQDSITNLNHGRGTAQRATSGLTKDGTAVWGSEEQNGKRRDMSFWEKVFWIDPKLGQWGTNARQESANQATRQHTSALDPSPHNTKSSTPTKIDGTSSKSLYDRFTSGAGSIFNQWSSVVDRPLRAWNELSEKASGVYTFATEAKRDFSEAFQDAREKGGRFYRALYDDPEGTAHHLQSTARDTKAQVGDAVTTGTLEVVDRALGTLNSFRAGLGRVLNSAASFVAPSETPGRPHTETTMGKQAEWTMAPGDGRSLLDGWSFGDSPSDWAKQTQNQLSEVGGSSVE